MMRDPENMLDRILSGLRDGVLVCEDDGRILLANPEGERLLTGASGSITGLSLYSFLSRPLIEHAVEMLGRQGAPESGMECVAAVGSRRLRCRLHWLAEDGHAGFILYLTPADSAISEITARLNDVVEEFRPPLANLRAAVENLNSHLDISPVIRRALENVIVEECVNLSDHFDTLARAVRHANRQVGYGSVVDTGVLLACLNDRLGRHGLPAVPIQGAPYRIRVDSYSLLLILEFFVQRLHAWQPGLELACELRTGDRYLYFDLFWAGLPLPASELAAWRGSSLPENPDRLTIDAVLSLHGGDVWSQSHPEEEYFLLRLAVPGPEPEPEPCS